MVKPLYKPGDRVVVVPRMEIYRNYGMSGESEEEKIGRYIKEREKFFGETLTIKKVHPHHYSVDGLGEKWIWTDEMFVGLEDELIQTGSLEVDLEEILCG